MSEDSEFILSDDEESADQIADNEFSEHDEDVSEDESPKRGGRLQVKRSQIPVTPSVRRGRSKNSVTYSDFVSLCTKFLVLFTFFQHTIRNILL